MTGVVRLSERGGVRPSGQGGGPARRVLSVPAGRPPRWSRDVPPQASAGRSPPALIEGSESFIDQQGRCDGAGGFAATALRPALNGGLDAGFRGQPPLARAAAERAGPAAAREAGRADWGLDGLAPV